MAMIQPVAGDVPVPLKNISKDYNPFRHFAKAAKHSIGNKAAVECGLYEGCKLIALKGQQTRSYTGCGNPNCQGMYVFTEPKSACPMCPGYMHSE